MPKIKGWKENKSFSSYTNIQYNHDDGTIARVEYLPGDKPFVWVVYFSSGRYPTTFQEEYKTKEQAMKSLYSQMREYSETYG